MPNWSKGTLKVRGTYDNLLNFCKNAFVEVNFNGEESQNSLEINEGDDGLEVCLPNVCGWLWMRGTRRGFVDDCYNYIEKDKENPDKKFIALFEYRQAWAVLADDLKKLCEEYDVEMKITSYERGIQFQQEIEIIDGEIVRDEEIKYDDYLWDCPCPTIGG